jgi:CcmD family protein
MGTFITAYAMVWLALVLYILRLRSNQRRIDRLVQSLESRVRETSIGAENYSRTGMGA